MKQCGLLDDRLQIVHGSATQPYTLLSVMIVTHCAFYQFHHFCIWAICLVSDYFSRRAQHSLRGLVWVNCLKLWWMAIHWREKIWKVNLRKTLSQQSCVKLANYRRPSTMWVLPLSASFFLLLLYHIIIIKY